MTDDDIWAYIFSNHLEYLPVYDYPYLDRRKNRNEITMLYNSAILESGMLYHYQRMYPEFFAWLKERWEGSYGADGEAFELYPVLPEWLREETET